MKLKHWTVLGFAWLIGGCGERLGEPDENVDGEDVLDTEIGDEPPDWMLGTFSSSRMVGCGFMSANVTRYVVHAGGRCDIAHEYYPGNPSTWRALWEQREPERYRVMRDENFSDERSYPIDPGFELEVIRSDECVQDRLGRTFHHQIYSINLLTGERIPAGSMRQGALCVEWSEVCVDKEVLLCEGAPYPPSCVPDPDPSAGSDSGD
jgi:hypothetical protein